MQALLERDGGTALLADLPPSATSTADTQEVGVTLAYDVTNKEGRWRASSVHHAVSRLPPVCT